MMGLRTEWDGVVVRVASEPPENAHEPMREIEKDEELRPADINYTVLYIT